MTESTDRMSVTLKQPDKERGKPGFWAVFHGNTDTIKRDILAYFGWSGDEVESLSLFELSTKAQQAMSGMAALNIALGATPIAESKPEASAPASEPAAQASEEQDMTWLLEKIKRAEDVPALKLVYAEHKAHFGAGTDALAAYKAHGKMLQDSNKNK